MSAAAAGVLAAVLFALGGAVVLGGALAAARVPLQVCAWCGGVIRWGSRADLERQGDVESHGCCPGCEADFHARIGEVLDDGSGEALQWG